MITRHLTIPKERIKSFVRRQGRISERQQRGLTILWEQYGLAYSETLELSAAFNRVAPLRIEIGFGNGQLLLALAKAYPQDNFLGIEVHKPGVGALIADAADAQLKNIKVICHDAVEVLQALADKSLHCVYIFFPDPWHKQRHKKRRLIQPDFVALLVKKLAMHGEIYLATDWQDYAKQMLQVLSDNSDLQNRAGSYNFSERPEFRPLTRFESRGKKLGHHVWDLHFTKIN